jgi:OmpA-OmpF porin, OOP family
LRYSLCKQDKLHQEKAPRSRGSQPQAGDFKLVALDELHQDILEKNMKRIAKTVGTLGLVGCAVMNSPFAVADDSFWYGGINIGQSRAKIDDPRITSQLLGSGATSTSISDDHTDTAYKLFGGYQFNKNFALEAGYFDLGKFGFTANTVPAGTLSGNIKLQGLNFDAVGMLPLADKFSVFGRLGLNYAQAKDNFTSTGAVAVPTNPNPSKNATNYEAGVGVQYDFTESLGMRVEAERYRIDDAVGNKGDINMYSLGLIYRFGQNKPAPAPEAATPPPPPPVVEAEPVLVIVPVIVKTQQYCSILDIQFEIKQSEMQREEKEKLGVVGTFMKKYPDTTAVIEGHTDNVGTREYNQKLSQQRADSVVSYLVDTFHIDPSRLKAVGYGEMHPIADNSTMEGRQANRRIDAVIACATDIADLKVFPARLTMAMEIEFDPYKASIDPKYADQLGRVADYLKANPSVTATVEGFADKFVGIGSQRVRVTPKESMEVSQRRAQSVVNYLVDKLNVSRSQLSTAAFGATRRVAYGTTLEGQEENRRVNIIFNYAPRTH